jgi:hypothetical protein
MNDGEYRELAPAVVRLLQGPVYDEDPVWKLLVANAAGVQRYLAEIGVELVLDESEGFAYLRESDNEGEEGRPRLLRRMPLSFEVSLLLVILREELDRFDATSADARRLYLSARDLRERIALYFKEKTDQTRLMRELDRYIRQVVELGFLREQSSGGAGGDAVYEVRRIVKAKVNNELLEEFKQAMEAHLA